MASENKEQLGVVIFKSPPSLTLTDGCQVGQRIVNRLLKKQDEQSDAHLRSFLRVMMAEMQQVMDGKSSKSTSDSEWSDCEDEPAEKKPSTNVEALAKELDAARATIKTMEAKIAELELANKELRETATAFAISTKALTLDAKDLTRKLDMATDTIAKLKTRVPRKRSLLDPLNFGVIDHYESPCLRQLIAPGWTMYATDDED